MGTHYWHVFKSVFAAVVFSVKLKLPSLKRSTDSSRTEVTGEEEEDSEAVEEEVFNLFCLQAL